MTERKPPGVSWESFVEKQIREAQEDGQFDRLPGFGQPLPDIDEPYDALAGRRTKSHRMNTLVPASCQWHTEDNLLHRTFL